MRDHELGRRSFVRRGTLTFLAVVLAPSALTGCGGGPDCSAGTTPDQLAARAAAHYLENGHDEGRNCRLCAFFTAGAENQCGTCALNMGAVNPAGVCDRFSERA